ncbi:hypothetical protein PoB_002006600 [Plakobranchus ocellatus]|uniref:RanBP2-type domain-containing protein n=1 Tax=Plakobranchus ocellatus TaxID=259542 RepID=A0AAV3Z2L7_9GAST|nr:hypothetical protein PoB_002006600 [Plakobranchus ocellatus]
MWYPECGARNVVPGMWCPGCGTRDVVTGMWCPGCGARDVVEASHFQCPSYTCCSVVFPQRKASRFIISEIFHFSLCFEIPIIEE